MRVRFHGRDKKTSFMMRVKWLWPLAVQAVGSEPDSTYRTETIKLGFAAEDSPRLT